MKHFNEKIVVSRTIDQSILLFILAGMMFLSGRLIFASMPPQPPDKIAEHAMCVVVYGLTTCGTIMGLYHVFYKIVANESALEWRIWLKTKRLSWGEILDYYDEIQANRLRMAVIIANDVTYTFSNSSSNFDKLKAAIAAKAINSKTKEWSLFGTRSIDKDPLVFRYSEKGRKINFGVIIFLNVMILALFFVIFGMDSAGHLRTTFPSLDIWTILGEVLFIFIFGSLCAVFDLSSIPDHIEQTRRKNQIITTTSKSISFFDGKTTTEVNWEDVTHYSIAELPRTPFKSYLMRQVETKNGTISYMVHIEKNILLDEIIKALATQSKSRSWLPRGYHSLDGKIETGEDGLGRYSYRSRDVRCLILVPIVFAVVLFISMMQLIFLDQRPIEAYIWGLFFVCLLAAVYLIAIFRKSAIEINNDAIRQISLFGERRIFWEDIKYVRINEGGYLTVLVKSDHLTIPISGFINDVNLLAKEIQNRSINAKVDCKKNE